MPLLKSMLPPKYTTEPQDGPFYLGVVRVIKALVDNRDTNAAQQRRNKQHVAVGLPFKDIVAAWGNGGADQLRDVTRHWKANNIITMSETDATVVYLMIARDGMIFDSSSSSTSTSSTSVANSGASGISIFAVRHCQLPLTIMICS
jgi:hypothetical protein